MTNLPTWRVWGRVAGPELPVVTLNLEDIAIGPLPPGLDLPELLETPQVDIGQPFYFHAAPAFVRVTSECYVRINVAAESAFAAIDKARATHVPLLQAALSLRQPGGLYRVQLVAAENELDRQMAGGPFQFGFFDVAPMSPASTRRFEENYRAALGDPDVRRPLLMFGRAIALSEMGTDPALQAASLLAFFQVLELVAGKVAWAPPADQEEQREVLVKELQVELVNPNSSTQKKVTAVRRTEAALGRLELRYTSLRIEHAARMLGLGPDWLEPAQRLSRLRNTALGHVSSATETNGLGPWFDQDPPGYNATTLVRAMLDAFLSTRVR